MSPSPLRPTSGTIQQTPSSRGKIAGVIDRKIDSEHYSVKTASGTITIKVHTDQLSSGDNVILSFSNNALKLEKAGVQFDNVEVSRQDGFTRGAVTNVKFSDLIQSLQSSLESASTSLTSENARAVLDYLKDNPFAAQNIDKQQLSSVIDALDKFKASQETLPKETVAALDRIIDILRSAQSAQPQKDTVITQMFQSTTMKAGVYTFSSLDDIVQTLDIASTNKTFIDQLASILDKYGTVTIKITGNPAENFIATVLSPDSTAKELQSLISGLKSPLLQSIPAQVLETLLYSKGSIATDDLTNLDTLIKSVTSHFPAERAGSSTVATAAMSSWLQTSIDTIKSESTLPIQIPLSTAQKIPADIGAINTLIDISALKKSSHISDAGITEELLQGNTKQTAIPFSVSKLGYDLEAILLKGGDIVPQSLKSELLHLQKLVSSQSSAASFLSDSYPSNSPSAELQDAVRKFSASLDSIAVLSDSQSSLSAQTKATADISQQLLSIQRLLGSSFNHILTPELTSQIDSMIKLLNNSSTFSGDTLIALKNRADTFLELLTNKMISRKNEVSSGTDAAVDSKSQSMNPELQLKIRQSVESALNRLESLQMLARQIPTTDGQQQMLALPMKIGDSWTEVNIRFLKKEQSSKKKHTEGSTYTVYLNLAPKNLGVVSVKMEYVQKKSLKIAMDFEFDTTKSYFQKFSDEIKTALTDLGLPIFSLDIRKHIQQTEENGKTSADQLIDVKV